VTQRVLIAGGGIAGLALAGALARDGAAVEVIERDAVPRTAGTGLYLPGNAVRALRALGVEPQGHEIPRQRFCDHRGRLLFEVDVARLWAGVGPCLAMHRADLHALLREAAGDVPVRRGLTVARIEGPAVELSDGSGGDYDVVVGADGIHSGVRALAFAAAAPRALGETGRRFLAPRPPEVTTWSVMLARGATFLTMPIDDERAYCYCDGAPAEVFADPAPALLAGAGEIHSAPIEEVALGTWVRDRVVLIGDAAHATSPNMAQGAAMALEDALVLAASLRETPAIPAALAAFEAARRPRTDWVRAQTHRRDRTRTLPPAVRNGVLRLAGRRIFRANYRPLLTDPRSDSDS
jgi:2-polyprenyl-6-methoxyphenol hydroxylase-like FAD-dependent oxidoreductase